MMFKYLNSGRVQIVLALLLLFKLTVIDTKALSRRSISIDVDNPCNTNQVTNGIQITSTESGISLSHTQTANIDSGLLQLFQTINNKAEESLQLLQRTNVDINSLNADWVIDPETMLVNDETRQLFDSNIGVSVVQVDQELYNLSRYLRYIRMNGDLSSRSSEEEIRENLETLDDLINSARCNLHKNYDIVTKHTNVMPEGFVFEDSEYSFELQRAFVVIRDTQRYMEFLTGVFQSTSLE